MGSRIFKALATAGFAAMLAAFCGCLYGCVTASDDSPSPLADGRMVTYDTPVTDTLGKPALHSALLGGASAAVFSVAPALPAGLVLNVYTGEISGTPTVAQAAQDYTVTALIPGGSPRTVIRIAVVGVIPSVAYPSPVSDTVGRAYAHAPTVTGGVVTSFAVFPALPAGLSLNDSTGLISGTPTDSSAAAVYSVVASGPGGNDTALIEISVFEPPPPGPAVSYASTYADTTGLAASHAPVSSGGSVTSYSITPALPAGLSYSAATGIISGTPTASHAASAYSFTATGPGGVSTGSFNLSVLDASLVTGKVALGVQINIAAVNAPLLAKGSAIALGKLIVTLTSSVPGDSVVRDTVAAGASGFSGVSTTAQTVVRNYSVKALRDWKIVAKTLDSKGILIHVDSTQSGKLLFGQIAVPVLNLSPKYVMWQAAFTIPDSLRSPTPGSALKFGVNRIKMIVDSVTVLDTSRAPGVFTPLTASAVEYDYFALGSTHDVKIQFIGRLDGSSSDISIYEWNRTSINTSAGSTITSLAPVVVPGASSYTGLTVTFGKVGR